METLVGADLQLEGGSSVIEATPVGTPTSPAEPGTIRDALGNVYDDARQASARASSVGGTAEQPGQAATTDGSTPAGAQPRPTPPAVDPTIIQAVQAAQLRAAQAEARVQAYEQAAWEQRVRALPADQQRIAIVQRQMELSKADIRAAAERQAREQQALEPLFKEIVVSKMTQKYAHAGVNAQMLQKFSSPEAMEEFCEQWAASRRTTANTQRQASGVDRAASAGSASSTTARNWKGTSLREQLSAAFE